MITVDKHGYLDDDSLSVAILSGSVSHFIERINTYYRTNIDLFGGTQTFRHRYEKYTFYGLYADIDEYLTRIGVETTISLDGVNIYPMMYYENVVGTKKLVEISRNSIKTSLLSKLSKPSRNNIIAKYIGYYISNNRLSIHFENLGNPDIKVETDHYGIIVSYKSLTFRIHNNNLSRFSLCSGKHEQFVRFCKEFI